MTMIYFFLIAFLVLNAADAAITIYGIKVGMREFNPVMRRLFDKIGVKSGLALFKVPASIGAIYVVVVEKAGMFFVLALAIPYAFLLIWNLYQLNKHKQQS